MFGWRIHRVCVADPQDDIAGRCEVHITEPASPRQWIAFLLAGAIAEQALTDRSGPWGDGQDRRDAKEAAMDAAEGDRLRAANFLAEAEHSARELVIEHAADIRTLAAQCEKFRVSASGTPRFSPRSDGVPTKIVRDDSI